MADLLDFDFRSYPSAGTIARAVERLRSQVAATKPRSQRRIQLETRLCDLVGRQLREEIKAA